MFPTLTRAVAVALAVTTVSAAAEQGSTTGGGFVPALVRPQPPDYPALAQAARVTGSVRLFVAIRADGTVAFVDVMSGHPMLDQAAVDAARKWRFHEALVDGSPIALFTFASVRYQGRGVGTGTVGVDFEPALRLPPGRLIDLDDPLDRADVRVMIAKRDGPDAASSNLSDMATRPSPPGEDLGDTRAQALAELARHHRSLGDMRKAASAFEDSEREWRRQVSRGRPSEALRQRRVARLNAVRAEYADVLDALGKPADARKMREEIAKTP